MTRSGGGRLRADISWLWAGYAARSAAYLGLVVVLTNSLGPEGFGALSLFLALTLAVSQIAGSWPFLAVPVLTARGMPIGRAFRGAGAVAGLAMLPCLAIALPVAALMSHASATTIAAIVFYSAALVGLQGMYGVLQTRRQMDRLAGVQVAERLAGVIVIGAVALATGLTVRSSEVLLAATACATLAAAVTVAGPRSLFRPQGEPGDVTMRTVVGAVGPMGLVGICAYGVAWADIYVLDVFRPRSDVGIYSLAYQVFTFVVGLGSLWAVALLPRHAESSATGAQIRELLPVPRLRAVAWLWAGVVGFAALGMALCLPVAFGSDFEGAASPMLLLLSGAVFFAGYFAVLPALVAGGDAAYLAKVSALCVVINVGLGVALTPSLGVEGPALATYVQSVFGAVALIARAVGRRAVIGVMTAGIPVAISAAAFAIDPGSPVLAALLAAVGAISLLRGWQVLRRSELSVAASPSA